jgi:hypothetical protein
MAAPIAQIAPTDAELLRLPAEPLSNLQLFVCTYVAGFAGLRMDMEAFTALMCAALRARRGGGALRAVNSNFGHECWPGYEHLLKHPAPAAPAARPVRGRPRKGQGDGTGFNSAVELILDLSAPGAAAFVAALTGMVGVGGAPAAAPAAAAGGASAAAAAAPVREKLYKTKVFPSTGETQVPGVLDAAYRDGHAALELLAALLNELGAGVAGEGAPPTPAWAQQRRAAEEAALAGNAAALGEYAGRLAAWAAMAPLPGPRSPVTIASENAKMLNYKFKLHRSDPRVLVDLVAFAAFLAALEGRRPPPAPMRAVAAPYPVRETTPPREDVKVSFRFECERRQPRVNIFQGGKINILGADSAECAVRIYAFFVEAFRANWGAFVCLQPRRDRILPMAAPPAPLPAPPPAPLPAPPAAPPAPPATSGAPASATLWLTEAELSAVFDEGL